VIQVRYHATDTEVVSLWASIDAANAASLSSASLASASSVSGTRSTTSSPNSARSSTPPSPHRLSGGAIAGIVIGAIAGLLFIIGTVLFLLRKRQRKEKVVPEGAGWGKQELDGKPVGHIELDADKEIKELNAPPAAPVELPGHDLQAPVSEMRNTPNTPTVPNEA